MFTTPVLEARTNVVAFCGCTERNEGPAAKLNEDNVLRLRESNIFTKGSGTGRPFLREA